MLPTPQLAYLLYARKSDRDRDEIIKSIEDQKTYCVAEAVRQNLSVLRTYEENQTAKIPGIRPLYNQMIADLKAGKANAILVYHVNRLARNVEEGGALAQMLIDGKVREIRTPTNTYRSGENILPLLIEQGSSAQFSVDLSRRMKDAGEQTAAAGGWPRGAPTGYKNERHPLYPKKSVVMPDPERFPQVQRLFQLFLTGSYSGQQLVAMANDEWGFRLRATPALGERHLQQSTLYGILKNPFYAGLVTHRGVQYKGNHEPMVTVAEFNQVQRLLESRTVVRRRTHAFTYNGLLRCGYCGQQIVGEQHIKVGKRYVYYRCADTYGRCTKRGIREDRLEGRIMDTLDTVQLTPEVGEVILEGLARFEGERHQKVAEIAREQQRTLREIEKQRASLLDLLLRGVIADEELFRQKQAELLAERNRLQANLLEEEQRGGQALPTAEAAVSFLTEAKAQFAQAPALLRNAIASSLARFTLAGNELVLETDPLLEAMANYAGRIGGMFETQSVGSGSDFPGGFCTLFQSGVPNPSLLELPEELITLLQEHYFRSPLESSQPRSRGTSDSSVRA